MDMPKISEFEDAYFIPRGIISRHDLVYDRTGRIIPESCVLRGENLGENASNPPEFLSPDLLRKARMSGETAIFCGTFMNPHFGHLVTEGISRLWYRMTHEPLEHRILSGAAPFGFRERVKRAIRPSSAHWQRILECIDLRANNFHVTRLPAKFSSVLIPEPTWLERHRVHPAHLLVAQAAGRCLTRYTSLVTDPRPVYFSRTRLRKANLIFDGESRVEQYCRDHGWRIVYPEKLSLQKQAALANEHCVFAGCIGSAFHSLLFRFVGQKCRFLYLGMNKRYPNYELMDQLLGADSQYIDCITRAENRDKVRCIDFDRAVTGLSAGNPRS
jgi:hypothetical protein